LWKKPNYTVPAEMRTAIHLPFYSRLPFHEMRKGLDESVGAASLAAVSIAAEKKLRKLREKDRAHALGSHQRLLTMARGKTTMKRLRKEEGEKSDEDGDDHH